MLLSQPATEGNEKLTLKDNLLQVYKHTGKKYGVLADQPECPSELKYLLDFYREMRVETFLLPRDIVAWEQMRKYQLEQWEINAIISLDWLYWSIKHGRRNRLSSDQG